MKGLRFTGCSAGLRFRKHSNLFFKCAPPPAASGAARNPWRLNFDRGGPKEWVPEGGGIVEFGSKFKESLES